MSFRFYWRGFKTRFFSQKAEILALVDFLPENGVAIDIGANKGAYIPALAKKAKNGLVLAFEPQPLLSQYLKKECACYFNNVIVENLAVSSNKGKMQLYIPGDKLVSQGATLEEKIEFKSIQTRCYEVDVVMLDQYLEQFFQKHACFKNISVIKMDVEGHELEALKGAYHTIRQHRPVIVLECEQRHLREGLTVMDVLDWISSLNYRITFIHRGKQLPIKDFDIDIHQKNIPGRDYWDHKDYCNNFVLFPV